MRLNSIRLKITCLAGICLVATVVVIVSRSTRVGIRRAMESAEIDLVDSAGTEADLIASHFEKVMGGTESLAMTLSSSVDESLSLELSREDVIALLRSYLDRNAEILGVFTAWEEDAFDGLDVAYAGIEGHDESGRFKPYLRRVQQGPAPVEPLEDLGDGEGEQGKDSYYTRARTGKRPLAMPVRFGKGGLTDSVRLVYPILVNEEFRGVVGVDLSMGFVSERIGRARPFGGAGNITIVTGDGRVVASSQADRKRGMHLEGWTPEAKGTSPRLEAGMLQVDTPIHLPLQGEDWGVRVTVPEDVVGADANALMWNQIKSAILTVGFGLIVLYLVAGRISRPARRAAEHAAAISRGDFRHVARSYSGDEIGDVGRALQGMGETVERLIREVHELSLAAGSGDLARRASPEGYEGGFLDLCSGMNSMIDAVAQPIEEMRDVLSAVSRGDLSKRCDGVFEGEFKEIADSVNHTSDVIAMLTRTIDRLVNAGREGKLSERARPAGLEGVFSDLVHGINELFESFAVPIQESSRVLEAVSRGDLTQRVEGDLKGDFAQIKESLNHTVGVLGGLLGETERILDGAKQGDMSQRIDASGFSGDYEKLCTGINELLDAIVGPVRKVSKVLAENSEEMSVISVRLNEEAERANEDANKLEHLSREVSDRVATVASKVEEMSGEIDEVSGSVRKASKIATEAVQKASHAGEVISELEKGGQAIEDVVRLINSIAEQTNLLALNATIEAARAGDAGKGFAVVAGEVKELASQTAEATQLVAENIDEIQAGTKQAIEAIRAIGTTIDEIDGIQSLVSSSMMQQASAVEEVRGELRQAAQETGEIAEGVTGVAQLMSSSLEHARETRSSSEALSEASTDLSEIVR